MSRIKIFAIVASTLIVVASSKPEAQLNSKKTILQRSQPYRHHKRSHDDSTFMTRIASWLFPSENSEQSKDLVPSEGHQLLQYLPPPTEQHKPNCNPCNSEPWIPVAANYGQNTLIGFVKPQEIISNANLESLRPPPNVQYGPPTSPNFHPKPHYELPKQEYGPPKFNRNPGLPFYDVPKDHMVPPPFIKRGPSNFSPSKFYGPPPKFSGPKSFLKPRPPPPRFGPPSDINLKPPPLFSNYKPSPIPFNYDAPHKTQLIPQADKYNGPLVQYGPPTISSGLHTGSSISDDYDPPPQSLPSSKPFNYGGPQKTQLFSQADNYNTPLVQYGPPTISSGLDTGSSISSDYGPPSEILPIEINSNTQIGISSPDSYSVPLIPNFGQLSAESEKVVNSEHLPPNEQLSLPSVRNENYPTFNYAHGFANPIPFPQMSHLPVLPLHDSRPFKSQFSTVPLSESVQDVKIVPSVPIADYLASIEHPINVVQSPILDLTAIGSNEEDKFEHNQDDNTKINFTRDPIVVEAHPDDHHTSASVKNETYYKFLGDYKETINQQFAKFGSHIETNSNFNGFSLPLAADILGKSKIEPSIQTASEGSTIFDPQLINQLLQHANEYAAAQTATNSDNSLITHLIPVNKSEDSANPLPFTAPPMDYSNWTPTASFSSKTTNPSFPLEAPAWLNKKSTTKKPKHIQIIIPYTSNKPTPLLKTFAKNDSVARKVPPLTDPAKFLTAFTELPTFESVWTQYNPEYSEAESQKVTATVSTPVASTLVYNIQSHLRELQRKLPYDVIRLQKNIDDWTAQEYSNGVSYQRASTSGRLVPSKKIPAAYLTTLPYSVSNEITTSSYDKDYDHEAAGSNKKESKLENINDLETNLIITETTTLAPTTTEETTKKEIGSTITSSTKVTPAWDGLELSISTLTKEKVYVVTPQPLKNNSLVTPAAGNYKQKDELLRGAATVAFSSPKFTVKIEEPNNRTKNVINELREDVRVIYSEWPHLINRLVTTTLEPKSTRHPLLGLMDLSSYVSPVNSTVETYSGHSKVTTVVTPATVSNRRSTVIEEKTSAEDATV